MIKVITFSFLLFFASLNSQPLLNEEYIISTEPNRTNTYNESEPEKAQFHYEHVVKSRIEKLNYSSPIQLDFNDEVKKYIDYFLTEKREWLKNCIRLSSYYFPIFEMYLDKYQLPMELKYLAVIESGLDPWARSKSGAVGLWQFIYPTSQLLNLKVNSFIDERQDPIKSTEAACRYLEYLFNLFGDWQLAIAAYNGGPSVVRNAIIRSGNKKNFWELRPYLTEEMQNYVPAFIAINYLMNYAKDYQLIDNSNILYYHQVDTVMINKPIHFKDISESLNISIEILRFLNPQYKNDYIPYSNQPLPIVLPSDKVAELIQIIHHLKCQNIPNRLANLNGQKKPIYYTVKKGDYLTKLAIEFRCSPDDIKQWNNLQSNELKTGMVLTLWTIDNLLD